MLDYVGLAGFLLALLSLSWQSWSFHKHRRSKLRAELITQKGSDRILVVLRVWNDGYAPAYLSHAMLTANGPAGTEVSVAFESEEPFKDPIAPHAQRVLFPRTFGQLAEGPVDFTGCYIHVHTPSREAVRLSGPDVDAKLKDVVEHLKSLPPTPHQTIEPSVWMNQYKGKW